MTEKEKKLIKSTLKSSQIFDIEHEWKNVYNVVTKSVEYPELKNLSKYFLIESIDAVEEYGEAFVYITIRTKND